MNERHVMEELRNIVRNGPVWPGDTLAHLTANECVRRGWAQRDADGNFVSTDDGVLALAAHDRAELRRLTGGAS